MQHKRPTTIVLSALSQCTVVVKHVFLQFPATASCCTRVTAHTQYELSNVDAMLHAVHVPMVILP